MQTKKFSSEKDVLTGVVIWSTVVLLLFVSIQVMIADEYGTENSIILLLLAVVVFFLLWIWFGTYYTISGNKLIYRSGPFRGSIDIQQIQHITKNKTMWVGFKPALGLRGLIIRYNTYDDIYISPASKDVFITELLKENHNIEVREGNK